MKYVLAHNHMCYAIFIRTKGYKKSEYVYLDNLEKLRGMNRDATLYLLEGYETNTLYSGYYLCEIINKFHNLVYLTEEQYLSKEGTG